MQISPPLVAGEAELDEIVGILGDVLTEASPGLDFTVAYRTHEMPVIEPIFRLISHGLIWFDLV